MIPDEHTLSYSVFYVSVLKKQHLFLKKSLHVVVANIQIWIETPRLLSTNVLEMTKNVGPTNIFYVISLYRAYWQRLR